MNVNPYETKQSRQNRRVSTLGVAPFSPQGNAR